MNEAMKKYPPRPTINNDIRQDAAKNWVQEYIPHDDEEIKKALQSSLATNSFAVRL